MREMRAFFEEAISEHLPAAWGIRRKQFVSEFQRLLLGFSDGDGVSKGRHFDRSVILLRVRWYFPPP
jgi:hypothetical protein